MISVKEAYSVEIVKNAKLAKIYGGYPRSDCAQVWCRKSLTVDLPHKIYS